MTTEVEDVPSRSRYEIRVDGAVAGFAEYELSGDEIAFTHTVVEPAFEGQGLAGRLVQRALDDARDAGLSVVPYCPYVRRWISQHPEYLDLVPVAKQEELGLTG